MASLHFRSIDAESKSSIFRKDDVELSDYARCEKKGVNADSVIDVSAVPHHHQQQRKRSHSLYPASLATGGRKRRKFGNSDALNGAVSGGNSRVQRTKFLLGGNICDPLNLGSLGDENINRLVSANTPECSPVPTPKHRRERLDVIIPHDVSDPLGLNATSNHHQSSASNVSSTGGAGGHTTSTPAQLGAPVPPAAEFAVSRPKKRFSMDHSTLSAPSTAEKSKLKMKRRRCVSSGGELPGDNFTTGVSTIPPLSSTDTASTSPKSSPSPHEQPAVGGASHDNSVCTWSVSCADNAERVGADLSCRPSTLHCRPSVSSESDFDGRHDDTCSVATHDTCVSASHGIGVSEDGSNDGQRSVTCRDSGENKSVTCESVDTGVSADGDQISALATSTASAAAPLSSTRKRNVFEYGNYNRYYGYRNPHEADPRLRMLRRHWVHGCDVLDIGCNVGHVTLSVARDHAPRRCVGLDIDLSLIKTARKNVRRYERVDEFPVSMKSLYGQLAPSSAAFNQQRPSESGDNSSSNAALSVPTFPANVSFVHANFVLDNDAQLATVRPEFDLVLCLSVTKWVHLNHADLGLTRFFRRIFLSLRPGGRLLLEPQPWASYVRKKKITPRIWKNFQTIRIRPDSFPDLLVNEIGFHNYEPLGRPHHNNKGFNRQLQLYVKAGGDAEAKSTHLPSSDRSGN